MKMPSLFACYMGFVTNRKVCETLWKPNVKKDDYLCNLNIMNYK